MSLQLLQGQFYSVFLQIRLVSLMAAGFFLTNNPKTITSLHGFIANSDSCTL